jgi:thiol-disulfide isomerase/thioredoxin
VTARRLHALSLVAAVVGVAAVVVVGVLLAGGDSRPQATPTVSTAEDPKARAPAPDLRGTDPITGETVALADYEGKPVVINIWASWCPGCNEEAADLRRFAAEHPEAVVLGIDFQDTRSGARAFYEKWDWSHASIFDPAGKLTARLGLFGMPTTIFLDRSHREVTRIVGETDLAGFTAALQAALSAS